MSDAYKIFRQIQEREKEAQQYKSYEKEDLIDEIINLQQENQQLKENKGGWQRLANKYFNALEDIKEYLKENEKEYGSLEDNEKIILDIVNKVLGSDSNE